MLDMARCGGRGFIAYASVLFLVALTGCARPGIRWSAVPEGAVTLPGVTGYIQERKQCGPFALAAVINYWHDRGMTRTGISAEEISRELYSRGAGGVLGLDLYGYAQDLDLFARQFNGDASSLRRAIGDQEPVIILVDYGTGPFQRNHFMVVSGYSSEGFVVHSGTGLRHIGGDELERVWARAGNWTLTVRPYMPEERIQRGLALERRGRLEEALGQYELAGDRDPVVHLYLGNVHYQLNDLQRAEAEYRTAIRLTGNPDAFNNLAWLYYELDTNLDTAFELAERAVGLVPDSKVYMDTLDKIRERLCASSEARVKCSSEERR